MQQQLTQLQTQSSHIQELHKDIQDSQGLVKEKDRKVMSCRTGFYKLLQRLCGNKPVLWLFVQITELSKEVFRLKEALGALSPPLGITSSSSSAQHVNPGQQMALQNRISILTQQLQVSRNVSQFSLDNKSKNPEYLLIIIVFSYSFLFCRIGRKSTDKWWLCIALIYCQLYRWVEVTQTNRKKSYCKVLICYKHNKIWSM